MYSAKFTAGCVRQGRFIRNRNGISNLRNLATNSQQISKVADNSSSALVGGLAGGTVVLLGGYAYYRYSGAHNAVKIASEAKSQFEKTAKTLSASAPEPNEALRWLRETAISYSAFIPGAKGYTNAVFDDLDAIHEKHGDQVDAAIKDAYTDLKEITKDKGLSFESAAQGWHVIQECISRIGDLAGDAAEDILNNHPDIKAKVGGNIEQLKSLGNELGPKAKEEVNDTWKQIQNIIKTGVSAESVQRIRSLVEEKMDILKSIGDEAWKKGIKEAKPYLDKSPRAKELIEKNAEQLKRGNFGELWGNLKDAVNSGNIDSLERYIKSTTEKAKSTSKNTTSGIEQYLKMVPGADQIVPALMKLQDIVQSRGKEAEELIKDTVDEVQQVLQKKIVEAEKLAKEANEEVKR